MHHNDSAMRGIDRKEQAIAQGHLVRRKRTNRIEKENGIGAVRMGIDQLLPGFDRAGVAGSPTERDVLISEALDGGLVALHFSPRQSAVAVVVEWQDKVQIAQRNIPLAVDNGLTRRTRASGCQGQMRRRSQSVRAPGSQPRGSSMRAPTCPTMSFAHAF